MIIVLLWYMSTGVLKSTTELVCRILHDPGTCCHDQHVARSDLFKLKDQKFDRSDHRPLVWPSSVHLATTHHPLDVPCGGAVINFEVCAIVVFRKS